jgi:hypothetical protein
MFQRLRQMIPADQALLSFESYMTDQHASKGAFYRPEIAFYLDRDIVQPATPEEIFEKITAMETSDPREAWHRAAKFLVDRIEVKRREGRYPLYLIPGSIPIASDQAVNLGLVIEELKRNYRLVGTIPAYYPTDPMQAGSPEYYIFDLSTTTGGTQPAVGR